MKKLIHIMIALIVVFLLDGCLLPTKEIARMTNSTRTDVFVEDPAGGKAQVGFVDLVIKASIKNPVKGYYLLEAKTPSREKPSCPFLLNIDGQAVLWTGDGQEETVPLYDEHGKTNRDPDAGVGIKYRLEKKIRLAAGLHKFVFALPNKDYLSEFKIFLNEGEAQMLEFMPRYRYKTYPFRIPTFLKGIERYDVVLNGQVVPAVVTDLGSYGFTVLLPDF
jgi:hypothetical protein